VGHLPHLPHLQGWSMDARTMWIGHELAPLGSACQKCGNDRLHRLPRLRFEDGAEKNVGCHCAATLTSTPQLDSHSLQSVAPSGRKNCANCFARWIQRSSSTTDAVSSTFGIIGRGADSCRSLISTCKDCHKHRKKQSSEQRADMLKTGVSNQSSEGDLCYEFTTRNP
jgi:hypothetical protein